MKLFQSRTLKVLRQGGQLTRTISASLIPKESRIFRNNKVRGKGQSIRKRSPHFEEVKPCFLVLWSCAEQGIWQSTLPHPGLRWQVQVDCTMSFGQSVKSWKDEVSIFKVIVLYAYPRGSFLGKERSFNMIWYIYSKTCCIIIISAEFLFPGLGRSVENSTGECEYLHHTEL